jgi:hypothetical protein
MPSRSQTSAVSYCLVSDCSLREMRSRREAGVTRSDIGPSLPASISDGVPGAGAGNLETTASEDDYLFSTASTGNLQIDVSNCSSTLGPSYLVASLDFKLVDTSTGATVSSFSACYNRSVSGLPAANYRLVVTRNGYFGSYSVGLRLA